MHPAGLEPTTYCSGGSRSIQMSYGCIVFHFRFPSGQGKVLICSKAQRRTNPRIASRGFLAEARMSDEVVVLLTCRPHDGRIRESLHSVSRDTPETVRCRRKSERKAFLIYLEKSENQICIRKKRRYRQKNTKLPFEKVNARDEIKQGVFSLTKGWGAFSLTQGERAFSLTREFLIRRRFVEIRLWEWPSPGGGVCLV